MALRSLGRHWRVGANIAAAVAAGGTVAYCEDPKTGVGFDPEALERGAKALREINKSPYAKKVQHAIADTFLLACCVWQLQFKPGMKAWFIEDSSTAKSV